MSTQELYLSRAENFRARARWADTVSERARLVEQASYWQRLADWERAAGAALAGAQTARA